MIDENIKDLKRLFGNYELDLPCTDSLNILSTTISMLEELKDLRKCVKSSAFKDGYQKGREDGYSKAEDDYFAQSKKDREDTYYCGYAIGRADAIDEFAELIESAFLHTKFDITDVRPMAEQVKENKNE